MVCILLKCYVSVLPWHGCAYLCRHVSVSSSLEASLLFPSSFKTISSNKSALLLSNEISFPNLNATSLRVTFRKKNSIRENSSSYSLRTSFSSFGSTHDFTLEETAQINFKKFSSLAKRIFSTSSCFSHLAPSTFETISRVFQDRTSFFPPFHSILNLHSKPSPKKIIRANKTFDFSSNKTSLRKLQEEKNSLVFLP